MNKTTRILTHGAIMVALATILSQAVSACWVLAFLCCPHSILRIRRAEGRKPAVAVSMCIQVRHKHAITRQRQFTGDVQHLAAVRSLAAVKEYRPRRVRVAGQRREYLTAEHAAFRADGNILR